MSKVRPLQQHGPSGTRRGAVMPTPTPASSALSEFCYSGRTKAPPIVPGGGGDRGGDSSGARQGRDDTSTPRPRVCRSRCVPNGLPVRCSFPCLCWRCNEWVCLFFAVGLSVVFGALVASLFGVLSSYSIEVEAGPPPRTLDSGVELAAALNTALEDQQLLLPHFSFAISSVPICGTTRLSLETIFISDVSVGSLSATPSGGADEGGDSGNIIGGDESFDLEIYGLGARAVTSVSVSFSSGLCDFFFGGNHRQTILLEPRSSATDTGDEGIIGRGHSPFINTSSVNYVNEAPFQSDECEIFLATADWTIVFDGFFASIFFPYLHGHITAAINNVAGPLVCSSLNHLFERRGMPLSAIEVVQPDSVLARLANGSLDYCDLTASPSSSYPLAPSPSPSPPYSTAQLYSPYLDLRSLEPFFTRLRLLHQERNDAVFAQAVKSILGGLPRLVTGIDAIPCSDLSQTLWAEGAECDRFTLPLGGTLGQSLSISASSLFDVELHAPDAIAAGFVRERRCSEASSLSRLLSSLYLSSSSTPPSPSFYTGPGQNTTVCFGLKAHAARVDGLDFGLDSGPISLEAHGLELAICASIGVDKEALLSTLRPLVHVLSAAKIRSLESLAEENGVDDGSGDGGEIAADGNDEASIPVLLRCLLTSMINEATTFQSAVLRSQTILFGSREFHGHHVESLTRLAGSTFLNMLLRPILVKFLEGEGDDRVSVEQCAVLALPPCSATTTVSGTVPGGGGGGGGVEQSFCNGNSTRPTVLAAEAAIAEEDRARREGNERGVEGGDGAILGIEDFFPGADAGREHPFNATVFGSYHNPAGGSGLSSLTTYTNLLNAMVSAVLANVPSELPGLILHYVGVTPRPDSALALGLESLGATLVGTPGAAFDVGESFFSYMDADGNAAGRASMPSFGRGNEDGATLDAIVTGLNASIYGGVELDVDGEILCRFGSVRVGLSPSRTAVRYQDNGNGSRTCDVRLGIELELQDSEFEAFVAQLHPILRALADSWARETACGILDAFLPYGLWWASVLASY